MSKNVRILSLINDSEINEKIKKIIIESEIYLGTKNISEINEIFITKVRPDIVFFYQLNSCVEIRKILSLLNSYNVQCVAVLKAKDELIGLSELHVHNFITLPIDKFEVLNIVNKNKDYLKLIDSNIHLNNNCSDLKKINEQMITTLNYDFKEILNTVINAAEMFRFLKGKPEKQLRFLKIIESSTENSLILLENIITWAKNQISENSKISHTSFSDILNKSLDLMRNNLISKQIEIEKSIEDVILEINSEVLKSLLNNLLFNVINYTKEYGKLQLIVQEDDVNMRLKITSADITMTDRIIKHLTQEKVGEQGFVNEGVDLGLSFLKDLVKKVNGKLTIRKDDESNRIEMWLIIAK